MLTISTFFQDYSDLNLDIISSYSYLNEKEDFQIYLNSSWNLISENNRGVVVAFMTNGQTANFGVTKNRNGYMIKSINKIKKKHVVSNNRS